MSKITFEFDMSNPDDKEDFEIYRQARSFAFALTDFREELRQIYKYQDDEQVSKHDLVYKIIDKLNECENSWGVTYD